MNNIGQISPLRHPSQHYHPNKTCVYCDARLTVHEVVTGDFCAATDCMAKASVDASKQKKIDTEKRLDKIASSYVLEQFGDNFITSRVPSNRANLTKPDAERLSRFEATLQQQFALLNGQFRDDAADDVATGDLTTAEYSSTAIGDAPNPATAFSNKQPPDTAHADDPSQTTIQASPIDVVTAYDVNEDSGNDTSSNADSLSCTTCNGHCCRFGHEHAFLKADMLTEILQNNPAMNATSLYKFYLQQIPAQSYEGSCIYQAAGGCSLPRQFRSSTCNNYECDGRKSFSKHLSEQRASKSARPIVVVAVDDTEVSNSAICQAKTS